MPATVSLCLLPHLATDALFGLLQSTRQSGRLGVYHACWKESG